jgi:hypothetical protein
VRIRSAYAARKGATEKYRFERACEGQRNGVRRSTCKRLLRGVTNAANDTFMSFAIYLIGYALFASAWDMPPICSMCTPNESELA